MRPDLDDLLRTADPAPPTPTQGPAVESALSGLVTSTRASDPISLAARRPSRARRWAIPATVGAVLVGGTAAAGGAALGLFESRAPISASEWQTFDSAGGGGCAFFFDVFPADGSEYVDDTGFRVQIDAIPGYSQAEFDAVKEFVDSHDWAQELTGISWADFDVAPNDVGGIEGRGTTDNTALLDRINAVLAENGLNTGGSAQPDGYTTCGVSSDGQAPWSGS